MDMASEAATGERTSQLKLASRYWVSCLAVFFSPKLQDHLPIVPSCIPLLLLTNTRPTVHWQRQDANTSALHGGVVSCEARWSCRSVDVVKNASWSVFTRQLAASRAVASRSLTQEPW